MEFWSVGLIKVVMWAFSGIGAVFVSSLLFKQAKIKKQQIMNVKNAPGSINLQAGGKIKINGKTQ